MATHTPTPASTPIDELPTEAQRRVREIADSELKKCLNTGIDTYQRAAIAPPWVRVEDVYAIGSVLTESFTPGESNCVVPEESDIDVALAVDGDPGKNLKENFWQYWNGDDRRQNEIREQIDFQYTIVDVPYIFPSERANAELEPPYYRL